MMLMSGDQRHDPEPLFPWRPVGPASKDLARSPDPATVTSLAHRRAVQRNFGHGKNRYYSEEEV